MTSKGKTWCRGTNSCWFVFDVKVKLKKEPSEN